jgi:hypothetical protein
MMFEMSRNEYYKTFLSVYIGYVFMKLLGLSTADNR